MISKVMLIMMTATTCLDIENNIIGLRFFTSPLCLPGYVSCTNWPKLSSIGLLHVSDIWFSISDI